MRVGLSLSEAVFRGLSGLIHVVLMYFELIHVVSIDVVILIDETVVVEEAMAELCMDSPLNFVVSTPVTYLAHASGADNTCTVL